MTNRNTNDSCGCMCYPNGIIVVLLAQLLMLGGFILSGAVLVDCQFVIADIGGNNTNGTEDFSFSSFYEGFDVNATTLRNGVINIATSSPNRRGFGFFNHQDANGVCHFEQMGKDAAQVVIDENDVIDYSKDYLDWLGPDWEAPRNLGIAAFALAVIVWLWLLLFTCIAHPRPLRYIVALLLILVVMPVQYATFAILGSEFCQERNCVIGRTSQINIVAGLVFFLSGLLLFCTSNYPGRSGASSNDARSAPKQQDEATHAEEGTVSPLEQEEQHPYGYSYQPSPETVQASGTASTKPQLY